jgi:hypothetical protein
MRITLSAEFLSVSAASLSAQELPAGFRWFGTMVGSCWIGQFPDGRTEHTQCYSGQFGKFMRGTASLSSAKETARQVLFEGDSLFAWDDASKRIVYYIWVQMERTVSCRHSTSAKSCISRSPVEQILRRSPIAPCGIALTLPHSRFGESALAASNGQRS